MFCSLHGFLDGLPDISDTVAVSLSVACSSYARWPTGSNEKKREAVVKFKASRNADDLEFVCLPTDSILYR